MLNNCFRKKQNFSFKYEASSEIADVSKPVFSSQKSADTNSIVMKRELNHVIESALYQVPADYRMVFSLREINGLSVRETAKILDISEANVKTRLSRAKSMLRTEVEKSYTAAEIFEFNLVYCDGIVNNVMAKIKDIRF